MRGWPPRAGFLPAAARLHWQPTCHAAPCHRAVLRRAALAPASSLLSTAFFGFALLLEFVFVADLLLVVLDLCSLLVLAIMVVPELIFVLDLLVVHRPAATRHGAGVGFAASWGSSTCSSSTERRCMLNLSPCSDLPITYK